jgi:Transmembrane adaptor Erv26
MGLILLPLLGYLGLVLGFCFLTLSIASGLYYLSELVEEHSVQSARVLRKLIYALIGIQTLLWLVDGFPWTLTALGVASHAVYAGNLRYFPVVKLTDPVFVLSCVLVLVNHWVWFRHFSRPAPFRGSGGGGGSSSSSSSNRMGSVGGDLYQTAVPQPSFTEIASFFGLCVWLVPFALFVSLSAGDYVLPSTMGSDYATVDRRGAAIPRKGRPRRNTGMAKAAVDGAREWVTETGAMMGLWRAENVRSV